MSITEVCFKMVTYQMWTNGGARLTTLLAKIPADCCLSFQVLLATLLFSKVIVECLNFDDHAIRFFSSKGLSISYLFSDRRLAFYSDTFS